MNTMDLNQAAKFLRMHPEVLRQKTKAGRIPGAKPGKCWVFLEDDLADYVRSQYASQRQATRATCNEEVTLCRYDVEKKSGGSTSRHQMDKEYAEALGLKNG